MMTPAPPTRKPAPCPSPWSAQQQLAQADVYAAATSDAAVSAAGTAAATEAADATTTATAGAAAAETTAGPAHSALARSGDEKSHLGDMMPGSAVGTRDRENV
jgi:hypothetical protein